MLPITHPDATAFAARFLRDPADRLGRLVFADWLEDQGGLANESWAQYLRFMAWVEEVCDRGLIPQAVEVGRTVRARLTLSSLPGSSLLPWLSAFLPAHRIWVRIGKTRIQSAVLDYCQENVAQLYRFMPVGATDSHLFIVVDGREYASFTSAHADVENFVSCRVTAFRGYSDDISQAIAAHHVRSRLWAALRTEMMPESKSW